MFRREPLIQAKKLTLHITPKPVLDVQSQNAKSFGASARDKPANFGNNPAPQCYPPLTQINTSNVGTLRAA